MSLLDVLCSPWAIIPAKLEEIHNIYMTHLRGEKINVAEIEAKLGRPLDNKQTSYQIYDGVAVVPIVGVIAKRLNLFSAISNGLSTELVGSTIRQAANDSGVNSIVLQIDSPGGTVDGTQTLANLVAEVAQEKPVVAFIDGLAASAGYWIASAAPEIYIDGDTTTVGSIGVVATHVDKSRMQEAMGIKTTEITAGKYKRIASEFAPLSEEGKQVIQDQVDYLYSVFVNTVARNRGASVDTVLSKMADGRLFTGMQAIDAGLADGVSSLDQLISNLAAGMQPKTRAIKAGDAKRARADLSLTPLAGDVEAFNKHMEAEELSNKVSSLIAGNPVGNFPIQPEGEAMEHTKESIEKTFPGIAQAIKLEGFEEGKAAGAVAERERILAVENQLMRGHEDLIAKLKADGKTTGPEAAAMIVAAEKQKGDRRLAQMREDAPEPIQATPSATGDTKTEDLSKLPIEERCKAQWDKDPELREEFSDNFGAYLSFEKAQASGVARIKKSAVE